MSAETVVCSCTCGEPFDEPAALGEHVATECDGDPIFETDERTTMSDSESDDTEVSILDYAQLASHEYAANVKANGSGEQTVVVDIFEGEVNSIGPDASDIGDDEKQTLLSEMVASVPDTFEQPMTFIRNDHQITGGGSNGSTGGSDGSSDDDDSFDGEIFEEIDADDADEKIDAVDDWLSNYSNVKSDMIDGGWHLEYGKITNPDDGSTEEGVYVDIAPFYCGTDIWDSDSSSYADDDAQDTFKAHREEMTGENGVLREDAVEAVVDDSGDWNEWYNYVPAENVDDL